MPKSEGAPKAALNHPWKPHIRAQLHCKLNQHKVCTINILSVYLVRNQRISRKNDKISTTRMLD
jgi:hypothetical protein